MKAIGYKESLPVTNINSLIDIELPIPEATGHDLLVKIKAIAVNPVDFKIRQGMAPENGETKVIGWDAVGEVVSVGEQTENFKVGDAVYYAGDLTRSGSNAEYQLVDERIVGHKPKTLSLAESAAIPLTGLTAWEALFDRIKINPETDKGKTVLIVGHSNTTPKFANSLLGESKYDDMADDNNASLYKVTISKNGKTSEVLVVN